MQSIAKLRDWRPGLRAGVLAVCAVLVMGTAVVVSNTVSERHGNAAVNEAVRHAEAVITRLSSSPCSPVRSITDATPEQRPVSTRQLERLVASGRILRIKVWGRGRHRRLLGPARAPRSQFGVEAGPRGGTRRRGRDRVQQRATRKRTSSSTASPIGSCPCTCPSAARRRTRPIGVYEVYEDAAPIEALIADTRADGAPHRRGVRHLPPCRCCSRRSQARPGCCSHRNRSFCVAARALPLTRPELGRRSHDPQAGRHDHLREPSG